MLLALALAGCDKPAPAASSVPVVEEDPLKVQVIVMSGQSNMEGSTYYDNGQGWLRKACEELVEEGHDPIDADIFFDDQAVHTDPASRLVPAARVPTD